MGKEFVEEIMQEEISDKERQLRVITISSKGKLKKTYGSIDDASNRLRISGKVIFRRIEDGQWHAQTNQFYDFEATDRDVRNFISDIKNWYKNMQEKIKGYSDGHE